MEGSPDVTLTLTGYFTSEPPDRSQVEWTANGSTTPLRTTFVSTSRLTAVIPLALLSHAGDAQVFLQTGDPNGQDPLSTSDTLTFRINARPPGAARVSAISPTRAIAGSPDITLTITGANFFGGRHYRSQAVWAMNGSKTYLPTTFVSSNQLTAVIPAALLGNSGTAGVFLETGDPMGDVPLARSNTVPFLVDSPSPTSVSGTMIIYGQTSTLGPRYKGYRKVALDLSPWQTLREGDSLTYSAVAAGTHVLRLSNPCTSTHKPSVENVNALAGETVIVGVYIPPNCE
jgi:hypothetical protein